VDRFGFRVFDDAVRRPICRVVDEDRIRGRAGLDPERGVRDVAPGHALPFDRPCSGLDHRLTRRKPQSNVEIEVRRLLVEVDHRVANGKRGADRALGVVAVRPGCTEEREHGIADELLDSTAEALELLAGSCVVRAQKPMHILRIENRGPLREASYIAEECSHEFPLALATRRFMRREALATAAAVAECGRALKAAALADHPRTA
jgi:hypothetical protein